MVRCILTTYGSSGAPSAQLKVEVPDELEHATLVRLYSKGILGRDCRYAVLREGRRVRAVFLANDLVPESAVTFAPPSRIRGKWLTAAMRMGDWGGGRVFLGPATFFRQVDLKPREAWLAPVLMGFRCADDLTGAKMGKETVYQLNLAGSRYYYVLQGSKWRFYGAGNTSDAALRAAIAAIQPADADALLWSVGAIPLGSSKKATSPAT